MEIEQKLLEIGKINFRRDKELPVIERGTDAWNAWLTWRKAHDMKSTWWERQERLTVPTLYPPTDLDGLIASGGGGALSGKFK